MSMQPGDNCRSCRLGTVNLRESPEYAGYHLTCDRCHRVYGARRVRMPPSQKSRSTADQPAGQRSAHQVSVGGDALLLLLIIVIIVLYAVAGRR
jgi:hypothetical protein